MVNFNRKNANIYQNRTETSLVRQAQTQLQQAQTEAQQAQAEKDKLAAKLREMGIDPNAL